MWKLPLTGFLAVLAISATLSPPPALGQGAESQRMFAQRMEFRLDNIITDIRRLQGKFDSGDSSGDSERPRTTPYGSSGGLLRQLETLKASATNLRRDVETYGRGGGIGYDPYTFQRQVTDYVNNMEYQLRQIKRSVRDTEARDVEVEAANDEAAGQPPEEVVEDGMTDEEWAAEWARGD